MFMLDTNICIYIIKNNPPQVLEHFSKLSPGDVSISSITLSELEYGAYKSASVKRNLKALSQFTVSLIVLSYDNRAASFYGRIRSHLEKNGTPIGSMDLLIAAHALSEKQTLVTNNMKAFNRVPGLSLVNWIS